MAQELLLRDSNTLDFCQGVKYEILIPNSCTESRENIAIFQGLASGTDPIYLA